MAIFCLGCVSDDLKKEVTAMKQQFGDQHFKTAISLIELHKIREGNYPEVLDSLKYIGDWDIAIFQSVQYKKLPDGYELNVVGPFEIPDKMKYPEDFWRGLGLRKSNVK